MTDITMTRAAPVRAELEQQPRRTERIHAALNRIANPERVRPVLVGTGALGWIAFSLIAVLVPDNVNLPMSETGSIAAADPFTLVTGLVIAAVWLVLWGLTAANSQLGAWARHRVSHSAAWVLGSAVWLLFWELSTAKTGLLSPPYFAAPQQILDGMWRDRALLAESLGDSLLLLLVGFTVGLVAGLITGMTMGWSKLVNYWVHPILIFIGPVPSLAWVPIVFALSPSAYSGALFMIALSVWFPISVLTRSGIISVPRSYYDVAQTLGAKSWFLVLRVSLPAALPSIFTGAFMALPASFVSLTVAEQFGVNAGLGWYLNYKKSWGDFSGLYGGLVVLIGVCGVTLTLLSVARTHVLHWRKELTRW